LLVVDANAQEEIHSLEVDVNNQEQHACQVRQRMLLQVHAIVQQDTWLSPMELVACSHNNQQDACQVRQRILPQANANAHKVTL